LGILVIIPVGLDDEDVRRRPWVSYTIIGVNVVVFLVLWLEHVAVGRFGLVPAHLEPVRFLTSLFVHVGLAHLLGNMIFFYITGPLLEDAYGRVPLTLLYLLSGFFAALVDVSHDPTSVIPRVGASGAIAGVMGAFLVRFTRRRIRFLWMPFFPFTLTGREFRVPAFVYLPFWFLLQYGVALVSGDKSGVAVWAHVGGFGFGFLAALVIAVTGVERRLAPPRTGAEGGGRPNAELVRAIKEGRLGHLGAARKATERVLAADPRNIDARRYAYELAVESGYREEIARCSSRLLDLYISLGEKDLARGLIRDVGERGWSNAGSRFLLRAGDFLARDGEVPRALELYDVLLRLYPEHPSALPTTLKVAELRQRTGDVTGARQALEKAHRHPEYRP
jgi:membrane associated rhomboid family serine protease